MFFLNSNVFNFGFETCTCTWERVRAGGLCAVAVVRLAQPLRLGRQRAARLVAGLRARGHACGWAGRAHAWAASVLPASSGACSSAGGACSSAGGACLPVRR
jgi:hypothetical protein